jgi:hypothetical protein
VNIAAVLVIQFPNAGKFRLKHMHVEKVPKKPTTMFVPKEKDKTVVPFTEKPNVEQDHVSLHSDSDQEGDMLVQDTFLDAVDLPVLHEQAEPILIPHVNENLHHGEVDKTPVIQEGTSSPSWADGVEDAHDNGGEYTIVQSRKGRGKNKIYSPKLDLQTRSRTGKLHHTQ